MKFQINRLCGVLVAALALGACAHSAATAPEPASPASASSGPSALYLALGQKAGIVALSEQFVNRLNADPRIAALFKESKLRRVKEKIAEQLCAVTGGPCVYTGDSMKEVHGNMGLGMKDFNALVEDLQITLDEVGVPFSDQNQLLALLAPMYRDMVKPR